MVWDENGRGVGYGITGRAARVVQDELGCGITARAALVVA